MRRMLVEKSVLNIFRHCAKTLYMSIFKQPYELEIIILNRK